MPSSDGIVLGFDPGGKNAFGWSICKTKDGQLVARVKTGLADDALAARDAVKKYLDEDASAKGQQVLAAGIDAPMFWSKTGNRAVDDFLRGKLRNSNPEVRVLAVNSLWGAVLVQGVLLGKYLRQEWKYLLITESHPNAMCPLLRELGQSEVLTMVEDATKGLANHKLDATLAAISAWAMIRQPCGWQDLYELECKVQKCQPVQPFNTPVAYWMPVPPQP